MTSDAPERRPLVAGRRDIAVALTATLAVATAVWLNGSSIHIVDWRGASVTRVGLFPPPAFSAIVVVAAGLVCALFVLIPWRSQMAFLAARSAAPLNLLWLWAVPYVPWLPDRLPLLLVLAGPARWIVLAAALAGSAWTLAALRGWSFAPDRLPGARTAFVLSLALYVGFGLRFASTLGPGGDEPHYLVITHSLLVDRDLKIENNHRQRHYESFFAGELAPHFLRRGADNEIYSIHAPGLPALLLPSYALGGYTGAVLTVCLFGAVTALLVFRLTNALAGRAAAWITWAAITLTVPFIPQAWMIYPEAAAAVVSAATAWWLWAPPPARTLQWLARGFLLALYPWLHTKFVVLMALLSIALVLRARPRLTHALALFGPVFVSGVLWLLYFRVIYGVFDPVIPYGSSTAAGLDLANIPRGVLGLLFDQEFGLLLYSPIYLLACAGLWQMLRTPGYRGLALVFAATTAAFVAGVTRVFMWWGGSTPPARFLVPVLPFVAPMLALGVTSARPVGRAARAGTLAVSLLAAGVLLWDAGAMLLLNDRDGTGKLVTTIEGGAPLAAVLPTLTSPDWTSQLPRVGVWVLSVAAALLVATFAAGRRERPFDVPAPRTIGAAVLAFVLVGSSLGGALIPEQARAAAVSAGRLSLLDRYDGGQTRALQYAPFARLDQPAVARRATVVESLSGSPWTQSVPDHLGPYALAPGRYQFRIWFRHREAGGVFDLVSHPGPGIIGRIRVEDANTITVEIDLPVPVPPLYLHTADVALQEAVRQVDIVPLAVVPPGDRLPETDVREVEWIAPRPAGLLVYLDRHAFPERGQFWTEGAAATRVLVAPAGAQRLALSVHCGPAGGALTLTVAGHRMDWTLAANETRTFDTPIDGQTSLVPVEIATPVRFRPADVDPSSQDRRWLGCHVSVALP